MKIFHIFFIVLLPLTFKLTFSTKFVLERERYNLESVGQRRFKIVTTVVSKKEDYIFLIQSRSGYYFKMLILNITEKEKTIKKTSEITLDLHFISCVLTPDDNYIIANFYNDNHLII